MYARTMKISDIGTLLIAARRSRGLTQRELGQKVGVNQQQVARWEATGYLATTLERIDAVARALDVGTEDATHDTLLVAETSAPYRAERTTVRPVRDLGEVAVRIREHGAEFRDRYGIARIGVFGSFAVGEQTGASDVDLLVEVENPGGFRFVAAARHAEGILGRKVDLVRPQPLKERVRDRVARDVVYVWPA
jgi:predicted nucleotidyltransferase/DNA-binding XRE family transcriptional regulator